MKFYHKIVFALCTIFLVYLVVILERNDATDFNVEREKTQEDAELEKHEKVLESMKF